MTTLVLLARVGNQTVAFDATAIESVTDLKTVVPVPFAPDHVHGLSALRSQVATVVDCGFAAGGPAGTASGRALVTQIDGHRYALRVDSVEDVVACSIDPLDTPVAGDTAWNRIATGRIDLGDRFALVVDAVRIVNSHAMQNMA
ncbi:MAG: CheW domain-containing protein [Sphingomonadales bacterium]